MSRILLGVDTGGTFTDFVCWRNGELRIHKVLSTPAAPEQAILTGMADLELLSDEVLAELLVVHGSTVATNAVLEGKGVRTAFITNRGLADLLTIGRQARAALYDLQPPAEAPPVAPELCLQTGGRLAADGGEIEPLSRADLESLQRQLIALEPRAVAINLLFSYLDDRFERAIEAVVPRGVFVSRSSAVLPEFREYERGMTTWLNAYVGPLVRDYLAALSAELGVAHLSVMQSSGGTIAAAQAGSEAVHMLLSGPAGGLAGAQFTGRYARCERLLTFDMGGTSTDVALVDGELQLTNEGHIGRFPVATPMVDMHTIGAGGGSIASVDSGGLLQVGPESAGAAPGPACYGRGGQQATVTDANLVLGRLQPAAFLGGRMRLDLNAARDAMSRIAGKLDLTVEDAALGILRVANEHMAAALRVMSIQRGIDPRDLVLTSFGGAGGLHVCALAEALGMTQAMVPVHAGVLSALGMLAAPRARHLSQTCIDLLAGVTASQIEASMATLIARGRTALTEEGVKAADVRVERQVDLRYHGQSYFLKVAWNGDIDAAEQRFHALHETRYGHRLAQPVELVNVRVACRGPQGELVLEALKHGALPPVVDRVRVHGFQEPVPVYDRQRLAAGAPLWGPALITETVSTTWVAPDWQVRPDQVGNLVLARVAEAVNYGGDEGSDSGTEFESDIDAVSETGPGGT